MKKIVLIATLGLLILVMAIAGLYWYTHRIESVTEAENYFIESRRAVLIQQEGQLSELKNNLQESGELYIPISELTLSHTTTADGGYVINAYSNWKVNCTGKVYNYTFFISSLGTITKQNETLIWEGEECID